MLFIKICQVFRHLTNTATNLPDFPIEHFPQLKLAKNEDFMKWFFGD